MLSALLTPAARARLARVALVRPSNARAVEDALLRGAASRGGRVDEETVVAMLDGVVGGGGGGPKVTIARRRSVWDDDD